MVKKGIEQISLEAAKGVRTTICIGSCITRFTIALGREKGLRPLLSAISSRKVGAGFSQRRNKKK